MKSLILPLVLALAGLGGGIAAGFALKPPPPEPALAECPEGEDCPEEEEAAPAPAAASGTAEYVPLDKPFIVPVFAEERVAAMVVVSVSLEVATGQASYVLALQPRLRDGFLAVMFRHANSGGFDGSFTSGRKMADLKSALLASAREVMTGIPVGEVLVTEIVRQDV